MNLLDLLQRDPEPRPWAEGEKIPWNDPEFSRRMLKEHLSQRHDAASRRTPAIKKQVKWIHDEVLGGRPSRVLDLGCGPGLYSARLAGLGHVCRGIDFAPASVEHAVKHAPETCSYALGDIRTADFGSGYDLVMLIFGEFNVFKPEDAQLILQKASDALNPGGKLLLEASTFDAIYENGNQPASWYTAEKELFAEDPYLCLMETFWDDDLYVTTERYYIVDLATSQVTRYASSSQAYEPEKLVEMGKQAGFREVTFVPSLTGSVSMPDGLFVALMTK